MRREITAHTRDPIPEACLAELAHSCGVSLHEVKPLELKWGYIPHQIVANSKIDDESSLFVIVVAYGRIGLVDAIECSRTFISPGPRSCECDDLV